MYELYAQKVYGVEVLTIMKRLREKVPRKWKWIAYSLIGLFILSIIGYLTILLGGRFVVDEKHFIFSESTVLQNEEGEEIIKLYDENRTYAPIESIPDHVKDAFVAIEDHRFYDHSGVDLQAILRAVYVDVVTWSKAEGASTITQQLVKNTSLTSDKSWLRKTKEAMGAIYLEQEKSKEEILEYYLNEIYFGHGIYGVEEAAQHFYSKPVSELDISEGAMLAALPKAPNNYSPLIDPEAALDRRNVVLSRMYELNMIDAETSIRARGKTLGLNQSEQEDQPFINSYIDIVLNEVEEDYHLSRNEIYTGGYEITIGLDLKAQEMAYKELQKDEYFQGSQGNIQSSVVIVNQSNGLIRAAIGGREYQRGDLNRVQVKRQPGSTLKPLVVYGPALEEGVYEPYSLVEDKQVDYDGYSPSNADGTYEGEMTLYDALLKSKNTPAVNILNELGVAHGKEYLNEVGIDLQEDGLAIALGGLEEGLTPLQLAGLYRTFYNQGEYIEPYSIVEVKGRDGNVLDVDRPEPEQLFSPQTSWYLTRMLEAVVNEGTGQDGSYPKALAGKTGSTQHPQVQGAYRDAWFIGYNPEYTISTWIGYDQANEDNYLTTGSSAPTRLSKAILSSLDETKDFSLSFERPEGVEELEDPVRLPTLTNFSADLSFGILDGLFIELTWDRASDERIEYHIYKNSGEEPTYVGKTTGKGRYKVQTLGFMNNPTFYVIPVNPLTGQEGEPSNTDSAY
ncbi:penicillin-binding protein [Halalkalibacillus sediminis]|uniref:Penicillin-binding protein n=1 Tax=Halalkalibacillus sediminis TaxID=2018042 RepID=A0A2I0QVC2_9BACI|nr:PBP1A family penicillin-binding protein [Halalkalibacillus sediminis]PKR78292.1 penicillin-binding protein [Halalkalibacillus sediminis]